MKTRVKICGITRVEDALHAAAAGADFLGYIFYAPSKRFIAPRNAKAIVQAVRSQYPEVQHVGVFVDEEPANIAWVRNLAGLDLVQLHGKESPEVCAELAALDIDVLKAIGIRDGVENSEEHSRYEVPYFLCDTFDEKLKGGTGRVFDLNKIPVGLSPSVMFIAGGLTPENIADMVRQKHPFAVDVSTGVEDRPGVKSHRLVTEFIKSVRIADNASVEEKVEN